MRHQTTWLNDSFIYEPPPPYSVRRRKLYRVFFILAGVAIVIGGLIGASWVGG